MKRSKMYNIFSSAVTLIFRCKTENIACGAFFWRRLLLLNFNGQLKKSWIWWTKLIKLFYVWCIFFSYSLVFFSLASLFGLLLFCTPLNECANYRDENYLTNKMEKCYLFGVCLFVILCMRKKIGSLNLLQIHCKRLLHAKYALTYKRKCFASVLTAMWGEEVEEKDIFANILNKHKHIHLERNAKKCLFFLYI